MPAPPAPRSPTISRLARPLVVLLITVLAAAPVADAATAVAGSGILRTASCEADPLRIALQIHPTPTWWDIQVQFTPTASLPNGCGVAGSLGMQPTSWDPGTRTCHTYPWGGWLCVGPFSLDERASGSGVVEYFDGRLWAGEVHVAAA